MSSGDRRLRVHRSLAVRLGVLNALLFGACAAAVLVVVYVWLARTVEEREREALELRAAEYGHVFEIAGVQGLRSLLDQEGESRHVRSLFVQLVGSGALPVYAKVPPDWPSDVSETMVRDGWGIWRPQRVTTVRIPRDQERDIVVVQRPLPSGVLLQVARSTDSRAVFLAPLRRTMWIAGPVAVAVAAATGAWLSWFAIRPVRTVATTARRIIETGDMSARVPGTRREDEVGELVTQFNTLLQRNDNLLRAMKDALDNVAHDVRTPLTRLRAGAEAALRGGEDAAGVREALADCVEETDRIRALLDTLLDVSAAEAGVLALKREAVDVGALVEGVVELYALVAEEKRIQLLVQAGPPATLQGDGTRLRQVVANLVDNAVKYSPEGGTVYAGWDVRAGHVVIAVRDTGPGVPPGEQDKIWRRLYRSDQSRSQRGLGLGLSVVKAVVEAHGGRVAVANHASGGAVFSVELPITPGPAPLQIAG